MNISKLSCYNFIFTLINLYFLKEPTIFLSVLGCMSQPLHFSVTFSPVRHIRLAL